MVALKPLPAANGDRTAATSKTARIDTRMVGQLSTRSTPPHARSRSGDLSRSGIFEHLQAVELDYAVTAHSRLRVRFATFPGHST